VFTYLATAIRAGDRSVPYSLIAALDLRTLSGEDRVAGRQSAGDREIVLNAWTTDALGVGAGDPVSIEYYLWDESGQLLTRTATFEVARSIPLAGLAADRGLAPDYPGITDSPSFADWDPPFPVDLRRIRPRDEEYWDKYRTTPKAFVPLDTGRRLWGTRYGSVTALRFVAGEGEDSTRLAANVSNALVAQLRPGDFGQRVTAIRAEGLAASQGATDFGEYFTYFSFLLVVSALLLAALFFRLGIEQRLREVGIFRALGFPPRRVFEMFFAEGMLLSSAGAAAGAFGGVVYGWLVMLGLATWWRDAVGTTRLELHVAPSNIVLGVAGGLTAAGIAIAWTLRRVARASPREMLAGFIDGAGGATTARAGRRPRNVPALASVLLFAIGFAAIASASFGWLGETAGFFAGGSSILVAILCAFAALLRRPSRSTLGGGGVWTIPRLGFRNAAVRPGRNTLCMALVAAATFIVVAVDAFRLDDPAHLADPRSGTGGFALMAETMVPLHHDPSTAAGRATLNLAGTPVDRWSTFRLRPGDDASCLNLYRPREPRILAPSDAFVAEGRFAFAASLASSPEERKNPWLLLRSSLDKGVVPVIADANSLRYVLHRAVGDEIVFADGSRKIRLKVVAALERSLFQSELLMSDENFVKLFPSIGGYRFFLIDTDLSRVAPARTAVGERLRDFAVEVTTPAERLAEFSRVENTYLTTFQMLGGLGLMLGSVGLATVLVRNVLERRRELALLRAVGYRQSHLALMVISENAVLLMGGLAAGTVSALLAIAPAAAPRGNGTLGLLIPAVLAAGLTASVVATVLMLRAPLLPALKTE
jgi:ABC-type lipoprotein release transport system permease subunit